MNRLLRALCVAWLCCAGNFVAAAAYEWKTVNVMGVFSFAAPKDLKPQKVQGIDSLVGGYRSSSMTLGFDHGWYSDPLKGPYPDAKDLVRRPVTVNGRRAELVQMRREDQRLPYVVAVHFPDLNDAHSTTEEGSTVTVHSGQEVSLTIWITCKTTLDVEYAKLIVASVTVASMRGR